MAPPPPPAADDGSNGLLVVGSANIDLVVGVARLPRPGETVLGDDHRQFPGGKGANQAVAAARLGAAVEFVGRVGADAHGDHLRATLAAERVGLAALGTDEAAPTGLAMIAVDPDGDNLIVVSPGANGRLPDADVERAVGASSSAAVLVQLEVPVPAVAAAARATGDRLLVVNPAPATALPDAVLDHVDVLVPNRGELATLAGDREAGDLDAVTAQARAVVAAAHGPDAVVVTLGDDGALVVSGDTATHVPAHPVAAVDATAAGDAFCAALTVRLIAGDALVDAARYANVAAAIAATRPGAQPSLPRAEEVDRARPGDQPPGGRGAQK